MLLITGASAAQEEDYTALKAAAEASFERFGIEPAPVIRVLTQDGFFGPAEWARAVMYVDGRYEIWMRPETARLPDLEAVIDHEAGHIRAWQIYGPGIEPHGSRWRRTCRKYAADTAACSDVRQ